MTLDIILAVVSALLIIIGFFGTFLPIIPGAPLAWIGLLVGYFSNYILLNIVVLIVCCVFAIIVSVADNIFPIAMTKQSGGTKSGTWGSTIGLIVGMMLGPWGIILGPFCGALIGEIIHDSSDMNRCLKAAFGAFKGFLLGTGLKMIVVAGFIWVYIVALMKGIQGI